MMKTILKLFLAAALALSAASFARAQAPGPEVPSFSQAELDAMLAPIALYPDSLLSQLLMAATYPRDVADAAAWSRANPGLAGEQAVRAVAQEGWDPSVKSLVAFPQVLAMMDEHLEWTERLGDAFMGHPAQVTETIQVLRGRADQAGHLRSGEETVVRRDYNNYVIEPAVPEVVYVPYYDPRVVYGNWWWPDYPPVYWNPWPGHAGYGVFAWGYGVSVGSGFWYTGFDWPRRYIRFHSHRPYYWRGYSHSHGHRWNSDRDHRRNQRNWHYSGYHGNDGRQGGYGRDGRNGRGDRRIQGAPITPSTPGIQRPDTPRYATPDASYPASAERRATPRVLQAAPVQQGGGAVQPSQRSYNSAPERQYVPPQAGNQPLSRGAISAPLQAASVQQQRAPISQSAPSQPQQRAPAPAPAPMRAAPPAPPAPAPAPAPRESRPAPSEPDSRPDSGGSRSSGGNPAARSGGRSFSN